MISNGLSVLTDTTYGDNEATFGKYFLLDKRIFLNPWSSVSIIPSSQLYSSLWRSVAFLAFAHAAESLQNSVAPHRNLEIKYILPQHTGK